MWIKTDTCEKLRMSSPIIQAPMAGGITTNELVAAVSESGGLGTLAAGYLLPSVIRESIYQIRKLTKKPFAVNLFIPEEHPVSVEQIEKARKVIKKASLELNFDIPSIKPPYAPCFMSQIAILLEEKVPIVSFTFGMLSQELMSQFKKNQTILMGTATTLEEAKILENSGVDYIIVQGKEAGGHRGTFLENPLEASMPLAYLIPLMHQHIKIPLIAAGGLMSAQAILNIMNLGASLVQLGTAFICCNESGAHPAYKKVLLNAREDKTSLTRAFSGKYARGVTNLFMKRMQYQTDILPYPIQNALTSALRKESAKRNCTDFMSMWAGQGMAFCKATSASHLVHELHEEMRVLIS